MMDVGVRLVRALESAIHRQWESFALAQGVTVDGIGGRLRLYGELRGHRVDVMHEPETGGIVVSVDLLMPLPPDCWIAARSSAGEGAPLGDLILDSLVVAGGDVAALRSRIDFEKARPVLLELLAGHPGSRVSRGTVELKVPFTPGATLAAKVALGLEVCGVLSG
jgi:hypothetical protein